MPTASPVTSPMGTQALWNIYPVSVRHWISRHGGLSRQMIYLQGRALNGIVASCDAPDAARAHCAQSAATRRVRCATYPQAPPATAASAIAA